MHSERRLESAREGAKFWLRVMNELRNRGVTDAATEESAREQLEGFAAGHWGKRYPAIAPAWQGQWELVVPFFVFPIKVRKIIYTMNFIESLHSRLRKAVRVRGHFPSDEAASKLLFLVLREVSQN